MHDFSAQRTETFVTYRELSQQTDLPDEADIDYFFIATSKTSDWRILADALSRNGFDCEYFDEDEPYLCATLTGQAVSAESIWTGEEIATRAALEHGFAPDGWGFEA